MSNRSQLIMLQKIIKNFVSDRKLLNMLAIDTFYLVLKLIESH